MNKRMATACGAVALAGSMAVPAVAHAVPVKTIIDCNGRRLVRPTEIVFTCADYGDQIQSLRWATWGAQTAAGDGYEHVNQCVPDCADGKWAVFPVHVELTTPVGDAFSIAAVTPPATGTTLYRSLPTH